MLSSTKSQTKHPAASQIEEQQVGHQKKMGLNSTFSHRAASGRGFPWEQTRVEETEKVNSSQSTRLLSLEEFDPENHISDNNFNLESNFCTWKNNLPFQGIIGASFRMLIIQL